MPGKSRGHFAREYQEKLDFIKRIATVEDILTWKNGNYLSVEEYNSDKIRKLGWEKTDVLYSFLSIYTIGMYAFYPERYYKINSVIKERDTGRRIYSDKFITEEHHKCKELNGFLEKKGFIAHYYDIGNVIPIWPGGNVNKGTLSLYDLPELYFTVEENRRWVQSLCEIYPNAFLDEVLNTAWLCDKHGEYTNDPPMFHFQSVCEFLNSIGGSQDEYSADVRKYLYDRFLDRVTGIICKRNRQMGRELREGRG